MRLDALDTPERRRWRAAEPGERPIVAAATSTQEKKICD